MRGAGGDRRLSVRALSGGGSPLPVSVGSMEVADKLRILEDLNMLYIRQIALSLEDTDIQKKIDHEIRMREGACKLLAACTQREQALEATKSLQVCNSRILAYMAELQRMKEAQVMQRAARRPSDAGPTDERLPCRGRVCVSDLRIPLMWKDTEYFRNKGELHRCAVFCLLQLGVEIYDTEMVLVDRTLTDICFENAVLFSEAGPDFLLKVELYSAGLGEEVGGSAPRKLASKLSSSLGRSAGRRLRATMDGGPSSPTANGGGALLLPAPSVPGPKYHLLAHTVLSLAEVQDGFRTHDLAIACNEESSFWLPLYGSMCCRLAAQPHCMAAQVMCGFLKVQQAPGEPQGWARLFCVLRGTNLLCYRRAQEAEGSVQPALTIAINKETRIRATEQEARGKLHSMTVTNRYGAEEVTHTLLAESRAETQRWMEAFWQHFYDMSQWKQCCDELMRIDVPPPRRPPAPLPRQGSLYHEMAIDPSDDIEAVTDILTRRAAALAGGARGCPPWLSLFEGPPPHAAPPAGCSPRPRARPRTLSLDAKLSTLKGRGGTRRAPSPRPPPGSGSSSPGSSSPDTERAAPPGRLQSQV